MKRISKRTHLLYIKWEDAKGCHGTWQYVEDLEPLKRYWIHSVGYLLREDEHSVHIAPHVHRGGSHYVGDMQIPKSAIAIRREIDL